MNEFNLKDGFENYIVVKIFYAPSNDKKVWKKKNVHNPICYINSFCCTIPKLTKIKNKNIYKKIVTSLKFNINVNTYEKS